jgi:hypothetical protein
MNANKLIAVSLITLILPGTAFAQEPQRPVSPQTPTAEVRLTTESVRKALAAPSQPRFLAAPAWNVGSQPTAEPKPSRTGKKIAFGILGGVGGFFGGAFLGHAIERAVWDCNCDDPGVMGFLIGAPTGAVLGAIAGVKLGS